MKKHLGKLDKLMFLFKKDITAFFFYYFCPMWKTVLVAITFCLFDTELTSLFITGEVF